MRPRWYTQRWFHLFLLTAIVLLAYWGMWRAYFATLDDFGITGWVRSRPNLWVAVQGYGSGARFLNYVPIWFKTQWFGLDAAPYLWSGLVQYLLLVWLIYGFFRQLSKQAFFSLLAALFFAVSYSHYEVVTYVSASDYTWWASVYLVVVLLFMQALQGRGWWAYGGALGGYIVLAFGHDFTLNLPLSLLAIHILIYTGWRQFGVGPWSDRWQAIGQVVRWHLPFWAIWALHVVLQLLFVIGGTSEAVYSINGYAPGLHMLGNLRYLLFLWLPNPTLGPVHGFLADYLSPVWLVGLWQGFMLLGLLLHGVLISSFWRGGQLVRLAVALIYLPFLQYTPWQGHFIEAPRYLLLPSIGASLLLACAVAALLRQLQSPRRRFWRQTVVAAVALFILANVLVVQIWVQQHVENGHFRRNFVTALVAYQDQVTAGSRIWIQVPEDKYVDLANSCQLVFSALYVPCVAHVAGEPLPMQQPDWEGAANFFWLGATEEGIVQLHPTP